MENLEFGFDRPTLVWLLAFTPLFFAMAAMTRQEIKRSRLVLHGLIRALLFALIVLAGAGLHVTAKEKRLAIAFVVDTSPSVTDTLLDEAKAYVREASSKLEQGKDLAALISFAESAVLVEEAAGPLKVLELPRAAGSETSIAAALRLARAALPPGTERKVVLITDGNETRGEAAREAARLAEDGIALSVKALERDDIRDALLTSIDFSTSHAKEGESVQLGVKIRATKAMEGTLTLYRDGFTKEGWTREVNLVPGSNPALTFKDEMADKGLYAYEAIFKSKDDAIKENNRALGFLSVEGRPKVLIIERREEDARHLARALAGEGISVRVRGAIGVPGDLADLESFDVVIFSDVPAIEPESGVTISQTQMELIRHYVEKLGGGFIMIGGEHSFGLGGYYKTPIADVLPVKLDIPKKVEIPTIGMCLVLDKSGSMTGPKIELAREASSRVVDLLKNRDFLGVVAFDSYFHWAVPMTRVSNKALIRDKISRIGAGGGTFLFPAMRESYKALRKINTKLKHCIILSDGQTNPADHRGLAMQMKRERMTISTIAIGDGADQNLMKLIARTGKGRFYFTNDFRTIPQIFTQETIKVSKSSITEDPFRARVTKEHQSVRGIDFEGSPFLYGYVTTRAKPTAEVVLSTHMNDPLYTLWNFGLGKVGAFTSDAKTKWAYGWLRWDGYQRFWAQLVRSVMRNSGQSKLAMQSEVIVQGDTAIIRVDAADADGRFVNKLPLESELMYWSGEKAAKGKSVAKVKLEQVAPGRYEGRFRSDKPGGYIVKTVDGKGHFNATGFAISYPKEFAGIGVDRSSLEALASLGGGSVDPKASTLSLRSQDAIARKNPLLELLLMAALSLVVLDIGLRRVRAHD